LSLRTVFLFSAWLLMLASAAPLSRDAQVPRYRYIFLIVEENKDFERIVGSPDAPTITALANRYGVATRFYAEAHPSEPNYVAMVSGSTYGIHDDAAFTEHTIDAPNLATQLQAGHLSWKEYLESLPAPGSLAVASGFYASKHSGFLNFASVQHDPHRAEHLVGFDRLQRDLRSGVMPNFSMIVPNVCNEMHGASEPGTPADCRYDRPGPLIRRGDRMVQRLVTSIMASRPWMGSDNAAIIITFDEDDSGGTEGCCAAEPGGGRIPTIVATNHGPRGVRDDTPYNHFALLRTIEDAFGIGEHLQHAGSSGVVPMLPLFERKDPKKTR
jgi:phosphatidylinositol-3-phosphatase